MLCHEWFLSYTSDNTVQLINDCYLIDLNILLSDKSLNNQRTIFERTNFSFLRILIIFGDKYEIIIQILAIAIDKDSSFLKSFDGLTNQYEVERIKNKISYMSAYEEMKSLNLMKQIFELSKDVDSSSQSINNILKDYWMIKNFEKINENIRRISIANIANLDEKFIWLNVNSMIYFKYKDF